MRVSHDGVREVLDTVGPLTSREIAEFFPGSSAQCVSAVVNSLRNLTVKQIYIYAWTRDNGHGKTYLRAVHALGNLPDARKPAPFNNAQRCARRRAKQAAMAPSGGANSIWDWAARIGSS